MITVIVPVYQAEDYLERCIDSILYQTYKDLEILLIDDGSTDRSSQICDVYAEQDIRVRVCHKINEGVSVARNTGLDMAKGEYITFVDSDDFLDTNMYEKMYLIVEKYNADVVMCDCLKENGKTSFLYTHDIRSGYYSRNELENEYFKHLIMMENVEYPPTISNWVILFKNTNNIPRYIRGVRYSEDLLFGAQLMYKAQSFYYMKGEAYYHYWTANLNSATHQFKPDKWQDYLILYKETKCFFEKDATFFSLQIHKMLLFFLYNFLGDIHSSSLKESDKYTMSMKVLNDDNVKEMFRNLHVLSLPIPVKLKIITFCYKYRIGIKRLTRYLK